MLPLPDECELHGRRNTAAGLGEGRSPLEASALGRACPRRQRRDSRLHARRRISEVRSPSPHRAHIHVGGGEICAPRGCVAGGASRGCRTSRPRPTGVFACRSPEPSGRRDRRHGGSPTSWASRKPTTPSTLRSPSLLGCRLVTLDGRLRRGADEPWLRDRASGAGSVSHVFARATPGPADGRVRGGRLDHRRRRQEVSGRGRRRDRRERRPRRRFGDRRDRRTAPAHAVRPPDRLHDRCGRDVRRGSGGDPPDGRRPHLSGLRWVGSGRDGAEDGARLPPGEGPGRALGRDRRGGTRITATPSERSTPRARRRSASPTRPGSDGSCMSRRPTSSAARTRSTRTGARPGTRPSSTR